VHVPCGTQIVPDTVVASVAPNGTVVSVTYVAPEDPRYCAEPEDPKDWLVRHDGYEKEEIFRSADLELVGEGMGDASAGEVGGEAQVDFCVSWLGTPSQGSADEHRDAHATIEMEHNQKRMGATSELQDTEHSSLAYGDGVYVAASPSQRQFSRWEEAEQNAERDRQLFLAGVSTAAAAMRKELQSRLDEEWAERERQKAEWRRMAREQGLDDERAWASTSGDRSVKMGAIFQPRHAHPFKAAGTWNGEPVASGTARGDRQSSNVVLGRQLLGGDEDCKSPLDLHLLRSYVRVSNKIKL